MEQMPSDVVGRCPVQPISPSSPAPGARPAARGRPQRPGRAAAQDRCLKPCPQPYLVEGRLQQPVLPDQQWARGAHRLLLQQGRALLWLGQRARRVRLLFGAQVKDEGEHSPQHHHNEGQVLGEAEGVSIAGGALCLPIIHPPAVWWIKRGSQKPRESSVQPLLSAVGEISGHCYFAPSGTSLIEPCPTQGREDPRD